MFVTDSDCWACDIADRRNCICFWGVFRASEATLNSYFELCEYWNAECRGANIFVRSALSSVSFTARVNHWIFSVPYFSSAISAATLARWAKVYDTGESSRACIPRLIAVL